MKKISNDWKNYILLAVFGVILFFPYLGKVHLFDWDEINFAEASREMLLTGDFMTVRVDFIPFHEKPPLFFWLQAISMKIFGVNEFAARLPNAVCGVITLLVIFSIGKKLFDERFGFWWVLAYIGSLLPFFYFKSGIIDPVFNLFIFLGIYYLSEYYSLPTQFGNKSRTKTNKLIFAGIFVSLAMLTKGPVGYLLPFLCWALFWFLKRKIIPMPWREFILFTFVAALPFTLWYSFITIHDGGSIFSEFISYQLRLLTTGDSGHGGPFYFHFVVLLVGCFPASLIMFRGFSHQQADSENQRNIKQWLGLLLVVVLVVFSVVATKIIHYSSLAYFPITFLAAYSIYGLAYRETKWKISTSWLIAVFGILFATGLIVFPIIMLNIDLFLPRVTDKFTNALLKSDVDWNYDYIFGVYYLGVIITTLIFFGRRELIKGFIFIFGGTVVLMFLLMPFIAPKIEGYTQDASIEFYQGLQSRDCYVQALGFKTYAPYFYSLEQIDQSPFAKGMSETKFEEWLLNGDIDKPAYFVAKNKDAGNYINKYGLEKLYSKNGFVFLKRKKTAGL